MGLNAEQQAQLQKELEKSQKSLTDIAQWLKARYEPQPDFYRAMQRSIMARINDDWFIPVLIKNGKIDEMVADMIFEFAVVGGKATGFEIWDDKDNLMARGKRIATP